MHHVLCCGKGKAEEDDEDDIGQGGETVNIDDPQTDLQQNARDRKDHGETKARFGKEESIPVSLHRPKREREIGHPEDDSCTSKGGRPVVQNRAVEEQGAQTGESRSHEAQFGSQDPGTVQVHDPHICPQ